MTSYNDIEFQKEIEKMKELQKEYEESDMKNLCVECGIDMGYMNPRQYCGKTYCSNLSNNKLDTVKYNN